MASPNIKITLDKPRVIRFGFGEASQFEELTGKGFLAMIRDQPFLAVRTAVYLGISWYDSTVSQKKAAELVQTYLTNGGRLEDLVDRLYDALRASGVLRSEDVAQTEVDGESVEGNALAGDPA